MNERLVFVILLGVISVLWYIVGYWRRKAGETAFLAARKTEKEDERDRLCRLAVRAGHRDACRMFCCLLENPLKVVPLIHSNLTPVKFSHSPFCLFLFSSYSSCPLCRVLH